MNGSHACYILHQNSHNSLKHTCQSSKLTTMFGACSSSGLIRSSSSGVDTSKIVATLLFSPSKISFSLAKRGEITAMAALHHAQNSKFH
jgi:hypothetical protein